MKCTSCQNFEYAAQDNFKFCPQCGAKLSYEMTTAPQPTTPVINASPASPQEQTTAPQNRAPSIPSDTGHSSGPRGYIDHIHALQGTAATSHDSKKVLIVEDDVFIRELYQRQFQIAGYATDTAIDGREGEDKIAAKDYDMILLDIMLPKMNGLDLLKKLKNENANKEIPVIILSNLDQEAVVEKGLNLGALHYVVKADITPGELLKVVENRIGR